VIELATRRIVICGITTNPNEAWMMQVARGALAHGSFVEPQYPSEAGSTIDSLRFRTPNRCRCNQLVVEALMVSLLA
jgi:hypothetical protein